MPGAEGAEEECEAWEKVVGASEAGTIRIDMMGGFCEDGMPQSWRGEGGARCSWC